MKGNNKETKKNKILCSGRKGKNNSTQTKNMYAARVFVFVQAEPKWFFFCLIKTLIEGQEQGTTNVVVVVIVVEIVCCLRFNMYTTKEIWFVSVVN